MNADIFAEWLRNQGYRVVRTQSSYWYEASAHVYQAFPYHWTIEPKEGELLDLLRKERAVALRFSAPIEYSIGRISYHAIFDQPTYNLETLDRRSRQNVRTGLENCRVEPAPFKLLAEEGWELEVDTAARQGRRVRMSKDAWRRRYLAAGSLPGFEAWGSYVNNKLVAALLTFSYDDCCELISQQCHRDYLNARVNNALTFVVTRVMMGRPGIRSVFYALQSLDAPPSVDEYKFRMGYRAKPVRQRVVFHPMAAALANSLTHHVIAALLRRDKSNPFLAKAEGMLRFYLEGMRPLEEQQWPDCLTPLKETALHSVAFPVDEVVSNQD